MANKIKDITGELFGKLRAVRPTEEKTKQGNIIWEFRCEADGCGNLVYKTYTQVKRIKGIASCGCIYSPKGKFKDLTGNRYGKLVVLGRSHKNKYGHWIWKCQCDCGNIHYVDTNLLNGQHTTSCGKCNFDLIGKKFGRLTVIRKLGIKNGNQLWECQCECGNIHNVTTALLNNGGVKSCSCYAIDKLVERTKNRARELRNSYPQWFIDELYYESDKEKAIKGELYTQDKVKFVCNNHGIYEQRVADHIILSTSYRRSGCPVCTKFLATIGSKVETEIKEYIENISNKKFIKVKILEGKEIDLYNEELQLGIEYNGSPYHATVNSRFSPKDRLYHQQKFLLAKEKGIHLINIFDVDWETNKDRIKMYLFSLFVQQKRLIARKCEIKKIDNELACEFADKYHIQGSNKNTMKINYGLYYNDELISIMGFGKLRLSKTENGQYELHRYCVKDSYNIVGGANKLLKAFERDYNPKYILSYSDNDYFLGGIYERLGFDNKGQCTPRYYWYLNGKEIKRERCRLSCLKVEYPDLLEEAYSVNAPNKEDYVMIKLGACKVYRSGNTKWEKFY